MMPYRLSSIIGRAIVGITVVEVMKRVEEVAWNFDPTSIGYEWNEDVCQNYQRHYPEGLGYQVLRPVTKMK